MEGFDRFLHIYSYIVPVIDIGVMAFLLYKAIDFIAKTNSIQIVRSALIIFIAYLIALVLKLNTVLWLMRIIAPFCIIAFAVIFQPEIRKLFLRIGQNKWFSFGNRSKETYVDSVLTAADILSKKRRGMLVVFLRHTKLDDVMKTGTKLNADLTSGLLVTIFGHDTPLHDGACFIQGGKVLAAGCFLPLSEDFTIKKTFGTRHRAALGLSESSDAVVLVVSEETGALSLSYDSKLSYDLSSEEIRKILENLLDITSESKNLEDKIDEQKSVN